MAKRNKKRPLPQPELNPLDFSIAVASRTSDSDAQLYANLRSQILYSHTPIQNKTNPNEIRKARQNDLRQRKQPSINNSSDLIFFRCLPTSNKIFFLFKDSHPIGFATINYRTKSTVLIVEFMVNNRLCGLGRIFYNLLEDYLRNENINKLEAYVPFEGSQRFWKKMGFSQQCNTPESFSKFVR